MSKRCARCGEFNPRRSLRPSGDWVDYLVAEAGASEPVGTLVLPLCTDCYADASALADRDADDGDVQDFLGDLDTGSLVDDVAG